MAMLKHTKHYLYTHTDGKALYRDISTFAI